MFTNAILPYLPGGGSSSRRLGRRRSNPTTRILSPCMITSFELSHEHLQKYCLLGGARPNGARLSSAALMNNSIPPTRGVCFSRLLGSGKLFNPRAPEVSVALVAAAHVQVPMAQAA